MVKQPAMESSEFTMSHEDFPALPGSTNNSNAGPGASNSVVNANVGVGQGQSVGHGHVGSLGLCC